MLRKRNQEAKIFKLHQFTAGETIEEFSLAKKKMMVGQAEHADIRINDPSVSHYHAFLIIDENGVSIIDLSSSNGTYVNDERVERTYASEGDRLRFGKVELQLGEEVSFGDISDHLVVDQDHGKTDLYSEDELGDQLPNLPPHPDWVVIDGEYCNIRFDQSVTLADKENFQDIEKFENRYSDLTFSEVKESEVLKSSDKTCLEVLTLSRGQVINIEYLPLKAGKEYFVSQKKKSNNEIEFPVLNSEREALPFIKVHSVNQLTVNHLDELDGKFLAGGIPLAYQDGRFSWNGEQVLSWSKGNIQLVLRSGKMPPHKKTGPFFEWDKNLNKEVAKTMGIFFFMLILGFIIDTTVEPPEKKVAVVYRQKIKANESVNQKTASEVSEMDKDQGIQKQEIKPEQVKMASAPKKAEQKPVKKKTKPVSKPTPKKVAKAAPKPVKKPYQLKLTGKLKTLLNNDTPDVKVAEAKAESSSSSSSFQATAAAESSSHSGISDSKVGTFGENYQGKFDASSGSKGLASKQGIDTTYVDPKTIVLGSIDPELLRKILKEYLPQFRHCYQQELDRNENVRGVVDMNFRIGNNGRVTSSKIASKNGKFSSAGKGCMSGVLKRIPFPKPKGGGVVDVRQPLNFFSERSKI